MLATLIIPILLPDIKWFDTLLLRFHSAGDSGKIVYVI